MPSPRASPSLRRWDGTLGPSSAATSSTNCCAEWPTPWRSAGSKTGAGRPAGLGHEYQDALIYASWGVDYLKYDWCNTTTQDAKSSYANMRAALDASGRPIVLSICEWGTAKPWLWGKEVGGNLWRTTGDIQDRWADKREWKPGDCCNYGVTAILDLQVGLESYAGPGHWNDPDMLEVGN